MRGATSVADSGHDVPAAAPRVVDGVILRAAKSPGQTQRTGASRCARPGGRRDPSRIRLARTE
jgi:hypothetical protein